MSRIFVPLAERPYRKFERGSKGVEIRSHKSPVAAQVRKAKEGSEVLLSLGYGTKHRMKRVLGPRWEAATLADLPPEVLRMADLDGGPNAFFNPDEPVLAFACIETDQGV